MHFSPLMWRRMPPAIFAPILGFVGLCLAWRLAGSVLGFGNVPGAILLVLCIAIYSFAAVCYLAKFIHKPTVFFDDLRGLPGRTGLSAMTLAAILIAAAIAPSFPCIARVGLFLGLGAHTVMLASVLVVLFNGSASDRATTPAWHLTFVGFIAVPFAAQPLGMTALAQVFFVLPVIFAVVIYAISVDQIGRIMRPAPQRPLLAIHLAPVSLFGSAAMLLGYPVFALIFGLLAIAYAGFLLSRIAWLTEAGFTPLWGAFTFPVAAFTVMLLSLSGMSIIFTILGTLSFIAANVIVAFVLIRGCKMWISGSLAEKTNAAKI